MCKKTIRYANIKIYKLFKYNINISTEDYLVLYKSLKSNYISLLIRFIFHFFNKEMLWIINYVYSTVEHCI